MQQTLMGWRIKQRNLMQVNKGKCRVLQNPKYQHRPGADLLENNPADKNLGG